MATNKELLELVSSQDGDSYIFGVEVRPSESNPEAFDCSERIEWACSRLDIEPRMPDGSWYQARHCRSQNTLIEVEEAINTAGALLFLFSSSPYEGPRPKRSHVAISQGDGRTFEARGRRYGVGFFEARGRGWTHAARIPGLEYVVEAFEPPEPPPPEDHTVSVVLPQLSYHAKSKGRDVRTLQGLLHARGLGKILGKIDGDFGSKTDQAVREFQRRVLIEVDGLVGERTWSKLLNEIS
ncbi:MAG: peptidoglycan-binding protein [Candidatus Hodarchaeota archaeon]